MVPTRVSRSRWRYPLRCARRFGVARPYSAPTTASASAESSALMIDCSSDRMRSGLASARASPSRPAGSTMLAAVIVMTPFEGAVRGSREGSRDGRVHVDVHAGEDLGYRATPLCVIQLAPLIERCQFRPIAHVAAEAGVSRACLSKWKARYDAEGIDGLLDRA